MIIMSLQQTFKRYLAILRKKAKKTARFHRRLTKEYEIISGVKTNHWIFCLYNNSDLHYVILSLLITILVLGIGLIISIFTGFFDYFTHSRNLLIMIFSIFLGLVAFGWYATNSPRLFADLQNILDVSDAHYAGIIDKWVRKASNTTFLVISCFFWILLVNSLIFGYYIQFSTRMQTNFFLCMYIAFLMSIIGFLIGTGLIGFVLHVLLLRDIFKNEIKFIEMYTKLKSEIYLLATFSLVLSTLGFAGVALFVLLTIRYINLISLSFVGAGTALTLFSYFISQKSIHDAMYRAKAKDLKKINFIYCRYYTYVLESSHKTDPDLFLKLFATAKLRSEVIKAPTWIFDTREFVRLLVTASIPLTSLILSSYI